MRFDVITVFPGWFESFRVSRIWSRAEQKKLIDLHVHDLRQFSEDAHHTVDDSPYGGGPGMVLRVEPLARAVESLPKLSNRKVFYATPQGRKLDQKWAEEISQLDQAVIVSGRYEGVDERFVEGWVDETFSIGDFVLSGGEIPALTMIDAVGRLIPGVVGDLESVQTDSFTSGRLKFPQYTRPQVFRGKEVPQVLLSGDHAQIEKWRREESFRRTKKLRPDLLHETNAEPRNKGVSDEQVR